jgi:hypothetical protein
MPPHQFREGGLVVAVVEAPQQVLVGRLGTLRLGSEPVQVPDNRV